MSTQTTVTAIPPCDLNNDHGAAYADASLPMHGGSWAYVCKPCFDYQGCTLGTGRGQRLVQSMVAA